VSTTRGSDREAQRRGAALALAFANHSLRRVTLAYGVGFSAEFGIWLELLIIAYAHGSSTAAMIMLLIQSVPSAALAPLIGSVVDRERPVKVMLAGYVLQALSIGAVVLAIS